MDLQVSGARGDDGSGDTSRTWGTQVLENGGVMISLSRDQHGQVLSPSPRPGSPPRMSEKERKQKERNAARTRTPPREVRHKIRAHTPTEEGDQLETPAKGGAVSQGTPSNPKGAAAEPEPALDDPDDGLEPEEDDRSKWFPLSPRKRSESKGDGDETSAENRNKRRQAQWPTDSEVGRLQTMAVKDAARRCFDELDADGSGTINQEEMLQLAATLGIDMKKKKRKAAFEYMLRGDIPGDEPVADGEVTFPRFLKWWNERKEDDRRKARRRIHDLFHQLDKDASGTLDKDEIVKLVRYAKPQLRGLDPAFEIETDWAKMEKVKRVGLNGVLDGVEEVSFIGFESWWKARLGLYDQDIPVMPEYLVSKIENTARRFHAQNKSTKDQRSPKMLWAKLRPKLRMLVSMQREWGEVGEIYDSSSVSMFQETSLGAYVRHPESEFSLGWDAVQIFALIYVGIVVPFRACFDVVIPMEWTFTFIVDNIVDSYFIIDMFLNFRTAYFEPSGLLEGRPKLIYIHYIKGWFSIDFVSCVPVQYFDLIINAGTNADGTPNKDSTQFRVLKTLRLVRLSKMLRLARIKIIVQKYSNSFDFSQNISVFFVLLGIFFLGHMLACFWYLAGTGQQILEGNQVTLHGWVNAMENTNTLSQDGGENATAWNKETALSTRYVTSLYFVFNALEPVYHTDAEKIFAVVSELMMGLIYGALAGVISTIMMSLKGNEQEYTMKLKQLRSWMKDKKIPKTQQNRVIRYFTHYYGTQNAINEGEIFELMPPSMAVELARGVYGGAVQALPFFRGLSHEVIARLCQEVRPMVAISQQFVITEGEAGTEMYLLMAGEVEVLKSGERLGFLSSGSFFGEVPILSDVSGSEIRDRTVRAVTDCELCYLSRESVRKLERRYPELSVRLKRFSRIGEKVNVKALLQTLNPDELAKMSKLRKRSANLWGKLKTTKTVLGAAHHLGIAGKNTSTKNKILESLMAKHNTTKATPVASTTTTTTKQGGDRTPPASTVEMHATVEMIQGQLRASDAQLRATQFNGKQMQLKLDKLTTLLEQVIKQQHVFSEFLTGGDHRHPNGDMRHPRGAAHESHGDNNV